jgi:hypothetical protein
MNEAQSDDDGLDIPPEVRNEFNTWLDEYIAEYSKGIGDFLDSKAHGGPPDAHKAVASSFVAGDRNAVGHPREPGNKTAGAHLPGSPFGPGGDYHDNPHGWGKGKKSPPPPDKDKTP